MSKRSRSDLWFICCRSPEAMAKARHMAFECGSDIAPLAPSDWSKLAQICTLARGDTVVTDTEEAIPKGHGLSVLTISPNIEVSWSGRCCGVLLHTSGSTGTRRLIRHDAIALAADVKRAAQRLSNGLPEVTSFVATVPLEHMFGYTYALQLSETLALPIQKRRPVLPEDMRVSLAEAGGSAWVVTTPTHLRSYVRLAERFDGVAGLIVATSFLDMALARASCAIFNAPILEIYGSTETGGLASRIWHRESMQTPKWQPLSGVTLAIDDVGRAVWTLSGKPSPITLDDLVHIDDDGFHLLGRTDDMVKIAGKRNTLRGLTAHLTALECVRDGIYVTLSEEGYDVLGAIVVPTRSDCHPSEILDLLSDDIDPIFLPKRIALVKALPRTDTGKLQREESLALLAVHGCDRHSF